MPKLYKPIGDPERTFQNAIFHAIAMRQLHQSLQYICNWLSNQKFPTKMGGTTWNVGNLHKILREHYVNTAAELSALRRKTYPERERQRMMNRPVHVDADQRMMDQNEAGLCSQIGCGEKLGEGSGSLLGYKICPACTERWNILFKGAGL